MGEVADPSAFHARTLFVVNPMPGGTGLKIKTVEALAAGRVVVTLEAGAAGLDDLRGHGLIVATSAEEFAGTCVRLVQDPVATAALGRGVPAAMQQLTARWRGQLEAALQ
jgi:hypothetical protein